MDRSHAQGQETRKRNEQARRELREQERAEREAQSLRSAGGEDGAEPAPTR